MKNKLHFILILIVALFNSCSTEVDITAPYKEIPIIIGLLSKDETVHYIKVNKAFLNKEGSAIVAASVPDSNLFPYPISVKLYAVNQSGNFFDSVSLDTVRIPKSDGTFKTNDIVYKTPTYKLRYTSINAAAKDTLWANYTVIVRKVSDGSIIAKATTSIVGNFEFNSAVTGSPPREINIYNATTELYRNQPISWSTARNGQRYDAKMRFKFKVQNDAEGIDYVDSLELQIIKNGRNTTVNGNGTIGYTFGGQAFYDFLQNNLSTLPGPAYRRVYYTPIEFHFQYAGVDLAQYMEINNTTVSLSDVKPEYTNVEGGYGIFSSRMRKVFKDVNQTRLSLSSIEELQEGCITGRKAVDCERCKLDFDGRACGLEDLGFR